MQAAEQRRVLTYLAALAGRDRSGLLEVRWRHRAGMRRRVYRAGDELAAAAAAILELGARTDIYVGCAPRAGRPGGLDAIARAWVLWVDCDTQQAVDALQAFRPAPAIVVRSGTSEHRHAYWTLTEPLDADATTAANRRLAHALGADAGAVTTAATILRPPDTRNFKHHPPAAVVAERLRPWRRVSATRLLDGLPEPPEAPPVAVPNRHVAGDGDALRQIPPPLYVQVLTGLTPGRSGKVSCPFHGADRTPSLHVYSDPADGWYCYGCQRGGSIYDLGAAVFGLSTRGRDFVKLRRRLHEALRAWAPTRSPVAAQRETAHKGVPRLMTHTRLPVTEPDQGLGLVEAGCAARFGLAEGHRRVEPSPPQVGTLRVRAVRHRSTRPGWPRIRRGLACRPCLLTEVPNTPRVHGAATPRSARSAPICAAARSRSPR
jgi:CHC2 zinc finger/RepB DNA-primase from phage plasmid